MKLSSFIDHTILKADCGTEDIKKLCEEAMLHEFNAICVPPYFVNFASRILQDSPVKVATVVGFPMGYSATPSKVEEAKRAVDDGADELDMVINICAVREKKWSYVHNDIESVTTAAHLKGKIIKVIFEVGLLSNEEVLELCKICDEISVDFVKTSTGYNGAGASVEMIEMLRKNLSKGVRLKASGGIRTREEAEALINAGANRLGCSRSVEIVSL